MIPLFKVFTAPNVGERVQKVFNSGFIAQGKEVDDFEENLKSFLDCRDIAVMNSATSALTVAYKLSGIDRDDEVIVTPLTCMATNEPLDIIGAKLVWADIDPSTGNIDPEDVKRKITKKTKLISAVHWAGQPFEIDEINRIASENEIKVVEDAAHAIGSEYKSVKIGNHSDYVAFSFQAIKHLTTGDGGALVCKNQEDDARSKKLRWFGLDRNYPGSKWTQDITESGFKFNMNNINAAIGNHNLPFLQSLLDKHLENSLFYDNNITNKKITKLSRNNYSKSSCWIYTLKVEDREHFKQHMRLNGVETDPVHVRNDKYSVFKKFYSDDLVGCNEFCSKHINIPVGWWLSEEQRNKIVDLVNEY